MVALRFENHAGPWLSPDRSRCRQIRAMIASVDQTVSELPLKLGFNDAIFILREIAAPDSTLIGDDHELVTFFLEPAQCLGGLWIDFDPARIATVIDVPHQGAVAVEKNSRPALVRRAGHSRNWR